MYSKSLKSEEEILNFWEKEKVYQRILEERRQGPFFGFYDGPPFATGLPHYGHLLAGTIKDAILRFRTMKGEYAPSRFGWDCHGLPIEFAIEKELNLSGSGAIEAYGIGRFNEACRTIVLTYTKEWKKTVFRMGRWVDFDGGYRTMDPSFMESVWWVFAEIYKKGLIYEGHKVMPFSTALRTPLSNFEANLNYKEVQDPSLFLKFPRKDGKGSFLVWTTTPWTLPANLALAVHPELDYGTYELNGESYTLLEERASLLEGATKITTCKGADLEGIEYEALFPYYRGHSKAFVVCCDTRIESDVGTGIVHMAPAFGELDFEICQRQGIALVCPVQEDGTFSSEVSEYAGLYIKEADKRIIRRLKEEGKVFLASTLLHSYPFCWRSDTPLIYRAVSCWFLRVEAIKDRLIANNRQIQWVPEHIQSGRFGKWLESARDWAIGRNRYWGTPIPLWRSEDGEEIVIGSIEELKKRTGYQGSDLHRDQIDPLVIEEKGKVFRRISSIFDCWFESGSMPYADKHYPFENVDAFKRGFPASFIGEGLDQTRGWFYTLHVLATALFDQPAAKAIIVNGIVLAEDGQKMSKKLKNYPDPWEVIERFGADAIRCYFLSSGAVCAEEIRFSDRGVEEILRQVFLPLKNCYHFFITYASLASFRPSTFRSTEDLDRWILSRKEKMLSLVENSLDRFCLNEGFAPIAEFIEELTNWYIRRSRPRFWREDRGAFETLYEVLMDLSKILAPFAPFLSESLYQELRLPEDPFSVHAALFPKRDFSKKEEKLEEEMAFARRVVNLAHHLRKIHKIKVRQPLASVTVISPSIQCLLSREKEILDELNIKQLIRLEEGGDFVRLECKPNWRRLGERLGNQIKEVAPKIMAFSQEEILHLKDGGEILLHLASGQVSIELSDIELIFKPKEGFVSACEEQLVVLIDTQLSEELIQEGIVRDWINRINQARKEEGFDVSDRILLEVWAKSEVVAALEKHRTLLMDEVLAVEFNLSILEKGDAGWKLEKM